MFFTILLGLDGLSVMKLLKMNGTKHLLASWIKIKIQQNRDFSKTQFFDTSNNSKPKLTSLYQPTL